MTMQEFCSTYKITSTAKVVEGNRAMDPGKDASAQDRRWYAEATHYRVTLKREDGRRMTVAFSCGSLAGYPDTETVLDCLCSDAASGEAGSFEDFCSELGYDMDSRKALKTYNACKSVAERLKSFLGAGYQMAVYEMERM